MAGKDPKSEKPDLRTGIPGADQSPSPVDPASLPMGTDWGVDRFNVSQGDRPKDPPPIPGGGKPDEDGGE